MTCLFFHAAPCLSTSVPVPKEIIKDWSGELDVGGSKMTLILHLEQKKEGFLGATLDSPDQGAFGIPVEVATLKDQFLQLKISDLQAQYEGVLDLDAKKITGTFSQRGAPFSLTFQPKTLVKNRPQEPKLPLPYAVKNVSYENEEAKLTLAGSLTLPASEGPFPAVILITGSGPHDRDETIFGHKPFLVLADHLTRLGIAVLRVDDRGVGKSTGTFETATSLDFAADVMTSIEYLKTRKEINSQKIGLIGHSEGGLIAPVVACKSKDVAFIVLMAGPGVTGEDILYEQGTLSLARSSVSKKEASQKQKLQKKIFHIVKQEPNQEVAEKQLRHAVSLHYPKDATPSQIQIDSQIKAVNSSWFRYFLKHDPKEFLNKVTVPILVLNGELDLQVSPSQNLPAISKALDQGGNRDYKIVTLPKLNHLFQTCQTGAPTEYAEIEETISPLALSAISDWILEKTVFFTR